MKIIPAIDLKDGKCVRLYQGDFDKITEYSGLPLLVAQQFAELGASELHIVDLDGAKLGKEQQFSFIAQICEQNALPIQVGGGIRCQQQIEKYFAAGVSRVVIGSKAITCIDEVKEWLALFGPEKIVLALDVKMDEWDQPILVTQGWQQSSRQTLWDLLDIYENTSLKYILCTDIGCDGTLKGSNVRLYQQCLQRYPNLLFQASGGVGTLSDLRLLNTLDLYGVIVGRALYENRFSFSEAINEVKVNPRQKIVRLEGECRSNKSEYSEKHEANNIENSAATGKLAKRIIACLDVKEDKVVKGIQFRQHQVMGDIIELASKYSQMGADELVFYDITASSDNKVVSKDWITRVAQCIDIPFCVAGGIRTIQDAYAILNNGADKISINSPALENPKLIEQMAHEFGSQCIVIGIDSIMIDGKYRVCQYTGNAKKMQITELFTDDWIEQIQARGAGEIVLNCMNHDGVRQGYDISQLKMIRPLVKVPFIASGGAGQMQHFAQVFEQAKVDGALAASVFHGGEVGIPDLKQFLQQKGIRVRL